MTDKFHPHSCAKIICAVMGMTALRIIFAAQINFLEDEAYYRLWGLYPSYAYFDHAPMVGWWIALGQFLFGDTHLGLRLLSPVAGLCGSLILWRTTYLIFDGKIANTAVILFNAMPLIGIGSVIMTPDVPSVFFWGAALWTIVEFNSSQNKAWWLAFGAAAGFGLLSKYTNLFLGVGILGWLALSGRWREAIRTPHFWLAGLIAGFLFSPVLFWNANHEWQSFLKQFSRLQDHGFTLKYLVEWQAGQIIMMSPLIYLCAAAAILKLNVPKLDFKSNYAVIIISAAPLIFYFLYHSFMSRINVNWSAPVYFNLAILAAPIMQGDERQTRFFNRWVKRGAAPLGYMLTLFVLIEASFAVLPADKRNPVNQIRGYDTLSKAIEFERQRTGASAVVTSRYQLNAMLAYELRNSTDVFQLTERIRYLNLPERKTSLTREKFLYVAADREAYNMETIFQHCFGRTEKIGIVERVDRGTLLATYELWLIDEMNPDLIKDGSADNCARIIPQP